MPFEAAVEALAALLGDRLSRSEAERRLHGQNETWFPETPPDAVAWPISTEEVSKILAICHAYRMPVVAWGTGTSLEGHALAVKGGLSLDLGRMDKVLEVRPEDMLAVVQPGVTREALNADLRATGLFFPVDPGANASLGGMAATRASGTTTVRYGSMRDNVAALEVVLADGTVIRTGSGARKSAAGYDLTALMLGSEGTLGIITELTLRLHGQPEAVSSAVCAFESFEAAVETVQMTIQMGIPMARIEFVDEQVARMFNAANGTELPEKPHLMIEFHGSEQAVAEQSERFGEVVAEMGGADFAWATTTEDRNRLWKMRHGAYPACLAARPGCMGLVTDICVPISRLAEAVAETRADIAEAGLQGPILGHVGDGNFHAILLLDRDDAEELARAKTVAGRLAERALRLGGTVTGEHGVGLGKRGYMEAEHGVGWQVMGAIKTALDPLGILNPGKLIPGAETDA
ncbi:FAD-binding oxidoreductase [Pseudothioclava nitratireducens]|uniref:FAD-binding oxidoreductase n=1 Tax=Pseudothioclava nitratireducens TaxID=1928646 RepID=UPI0023DA9C7C|nr:FAD-linked oxidase C-terminal domain-containing protein [Defluviimonas nitratireducens]MDF1620135.1 FAD-linked oxidase C-terminal domain-containing protein [Defluviimonas nitratireducens]